MTLAQEVGAANVLEGLPKRIRQVIDRNAPGRLALVDDNAHGLLAISTGKIKILKHRLMESLAAGTHSIAPKSRES